MQGHHAPHILLQMKIHVFVGSMPSRPCPEALPLRTSALGNLILAESSDMMSTGQPQPSSFVLFIFILLSLIYNYMKNIMFTRLSLSPSPPSKPHYSPCPSVQEDGVKSLLVFSVLHIPPYTPPTLYMLIIRPTFFFPALSLPSQLACPVPFPLVTVSPSLGSVILLLFCSFSFSLFLCSTDE